MFPILHAEETDTQLHTNVEPWNEVDLGRKEKVKMKMKIQNGDKEEKRKYIKRYRNCSRKMEEPSVSLQKEQGRCMMTRRAPYSMQAEWLAEPRSLRFGSRGIICMASWWTDWVKARWLHRRRGLIYLSIYLSTYLSILPLQYSIHACSVGTLYRIPFRYPVHTSELPASSKWRPIPWFFKFPSTATWSTRWAIFFSFFSFLDL